MAPMKIDKAYIKKLIQVLNKYYLSDGLNKYLKSKGVGRLSAKERKMISDLQSPQRVIFCRCVNESFKKAQAVIIEHRLQIERAVKRDNCEYTSPYTPTYALKLLTDYADAIAWVMLGQDISAVRNCFLGYKEFVRLEECNWPSVELSLRQLNKNPDRFALASDLTSFLHVGDILLRDTKDNYIKMLEVKTGRVNEELLRILDLETDAKRETRLRALFQSQENPKALVKHVIRFARQMQRGWDSEGYWKADRKQRVDIKTRKQVRVIEEERKEQSWYTAVRGVLKQAKSRELNVTGIADECLFFAYGQESLTPTNFLYVMHIIRQKFELDSLPSGDRIFDTMSALGSGHSLSQKLAVCIAIG